MSILEVFENTDCRLPKLPSPTICELPCIDLMNVILKKIKDKYEYKNKLAADIYWLKQCINYAFLTCLKTTMSDEREDPYFLVCR